MFSRTSALRLLPLALALALAAANQEPPLTGAEGFLGGEAEGQGQSFYAVARVLDGEEVDSVFGAREAGDCATACRKNSECAWFNHCKEQVWGLGSDIAGWAPPPRHPPSGTARCTAMFAFSPSAIPPCAAAPPLQDGCLGAQNRTLSFQQCQLLTSNCTLVPAVAWRGSQADLDTTAGFPVRFLPPPALPGMVNRLVQGIEGGAQGAGAPHACMAA